MTTLAQIVAVEKGVKAKTLRDTTDDYHDLQKAALLSGIARTYRPVDDEGDQLPPERTLVQLNAEDALRRAARSLTRLFDLTLTKDTANQEARADVVVGGHVIARGVPVTTLLFLDKQLLDLSTVVKALPVLDPSETWERDPATGVFRTPVVQTTRTQKVMQAFEVSPATDKHPAQATTYNKDVIVGRWDTRRFSGAVERDRKDLLVERVTRLIEAVKFAREEANRLEVADAEVGDAVFGWLLAAEPDAPQ